MNDLRDYPLLVLVVCFVLLWLAARIGAFLRKRGADPAGDLSQDYSIVLGATLTLLGLVIGFTFSMATSRYDQRKNLEEAEANAIGTEYLRADLLPAVDAAKVKDLLKRYLDQRVLFYETRDEQQLAAIDASTAALQAALWSAVLAPSTAQPTPLVALTLGGMNDVLNAQGYIQAAWWNRIPIPAWTLMAAIALCSSFLVGYGWRRAKDATTLLLVLPLVIAIAFMLIADIDTPRYGLINVVPENLVSLAQALRAH